MAIANLNFSSQFPLVSAAESSLTEREASVRRDQERLEAKVAAFNNQRSEFSAKVSKAEEEFDAEDKRLTAEAARAGSSKRYTAVLICGRLNVDKIQKLREKGGPQAAQLCSAPERNSSSQSEAKFDQTLMLKWGI